MEQVSLLEIIRECNKITHDQAKLEECHKLYLPDKGRELEFFGYLTPGVFKAIPWKDHGFSVKAREVKPITSDPKTINKYLEAIALDSQIRNQGAVKDLCAWDGKEHVRLIVGHPKLKFGDCLGVYLGVVQVGVHLNVYRDKPLVQGEEPSVRILVQRRAKEASTYAGKLDQAAAGGLQYGESPSEGMLREAKEEITTDENDGLIKSLINDEASYDGDVSFFNVRSAEKFNGTLEPSIKACYSIKAPDGWEPPANSNDPKVRTFEFMSPGEVITALRGRQFKPNSGLVMIKFLIGQGFITKEEPNFKEICSELKADIRLPRPKDLSKMDA